MLAITKKYDYDASNTGKIFAQDINTIVNELNKLISESGNREPSSTRQFFKAVDELVKHNTYKDVGVANAISLERDGLTTAVESYIDGMTVFFVVAENNTGATTITVKDLGLKPLKLYGTALTADAVQSGKMYSARYDISTDSFELIAFGSVGSIAYAFSDVVSAVGTEDPDATTSDIIITQHTNCPEDTTRTPTYTNDSLAQTVDLNVGDVVLHQGSLNADFATTGVSQVVSISPGDKVYFEVASGTTGTGTLTMTYTSLITNASIDLDTVDFTNGVNWQPVGLEGHYYQNNTNRLGIELSLDYYLHPTDWTDLGIDWVNQSSSWYIKTIFYGTPGNLSDRAQIAIEYNPLNGVSVRAGVRSIKSSIKQPWIEMTADNLSTIVLDTIKDNVTVEYDTFAETELLIESLAGNYAALVIAVGNLANKTGNVNNTFAVATPQVSSDLMNKQSVLSQLGNPTLTTIDPNVTTDKLIYTVHANCPDDTAEWIITTRFLGTRGSNTDRSQIAVEFDSATQTPRVFTRTMKLGTESTWQQLDNKGYIANNRGKFTFGDTPPTTASYGDKFLNIFTGSIHIYANDGLNDAWLVLQESTTDNTTVFIEDSDGAIITSTLPFSVNQDVGQNDWVRTKVTITTKANDIIATVNSKELVEETNTITDPNIINVNASKNSLFFVSESREGYFSGEPIPNVFSSNVISPLGITNVKQLAGANVVEMEDYVPSASGTLVPAWLYGSNFIIALKYDGTVWGIGTSLNGEFGQGSRAQTLSAWTNLGLSQIVKIHVSGKGTVFAVTSGGSLYVTGNNYFNEAGTTTYAPINTWTQVVTGDVKDVFTSGYKSYLLTHSGDVKVSGYCEKGEFGTGVLETRITSFTSIGFTDAVQVSASWQHTIIVKSDGRIYGAGNNVDGQLGLGSSLPEVVTWTRLSPTGVDYVVTHDFSTMVFPGRLVTGKSETRFNLFGIPNNMSYTFVDSDITDALPLYPFNDDWIYAKYAINFPYLGFNPTDVRTLSVKGDNAYGQLGIGSISTTTAWTSLSYNNINFTYQKLFKDVLFDPSVRTLNFDADQDIIELQASVWTL